MMNIIQQINEGKLICPKTKQKLFLSSDGEYLTTKDGVEKYNMLEKRVPI